jgi:hypothetical protein
MDEKRFDAIAQTLGDGATRRTAGRLLAGGALAGVVGWLGLSADGEAKRKRKKKSKKKKRCPSSQPKKCSPTSLDPQGLCVPSGFTCCSEALGGGACNPENPQCCAPTFQDPGGLCIPGGSVCCTSAEGGGFCGPGATCCPPVPGFPDGLCASPGFDCPLGFSSSRMNGISERQTNAPSRSAGGR